MLNNGRDEKTITKLKQMLASRYGKGLELRSLTSVSLEESVQGHALRGQDLLIPLRIQDAFLGTAVVPSAGDLSSESRQQITQMVRMILEPALYRDYLERRENNLRSLAEEGLDTTNLRVLNEVPVPEEIEQRRSGQLQMNVSLVHLHGHEQQRIKKAALLLHEMTGRWAFVPFNDIKKDLNTVSDLLNLGAMTLLIDDVQNLDGDAQKLVLEYLSVTRSDRHPLFVTGSTMSLEEVAQAGGLLAEFKDELMATSLELDRAPLSEKGLREVINLMFFTLAGQD